LVQFRLIVCPENAEEISGKFIPKGHFGGGYPAGLKVTFRTGCRVETFSRLEGKRLGFRRKEIPLAGHELFGHRSKTRAFYED